MATGKQFKVHSMAAAKKVARQRRAKPPVVIHLPAPELKREVHRVSRGDYKRVQFLSATTAIIWNSHDQKRRMQGKVI